MQEIMLENHNKGSSKQDKKPSKKIARMLVTKEPMKMHRDR